MNAGRRRRFGSNRTRWNTGQVPVVESHMDTAFPAVHRSRRHNLLGLSGTDPKAMHRYLNAILAVDPTSAQHRWLRAIVRYRLEDRPGSSADVEWLLANKPDGIDLARVHELQRALAGQAEPR